MKEQALLTSRWIYASERKTAMKTALLLDIDNTLTPPRQPLSKEMADVLQRLCVPFHVAAGSDMPLLQKQFFEPLREFGFRGRFDAFVSNGAIHYRCDYSEVMSLQLVSAFDLRDYLGDADYDFLIDVLEKTLRVPEFQLRPPLKVMGEQIVYRGSMINVPPIGRVTQEGAESLLNRKRFVEFDRVYGYRQKVLAHLKRELAMLIDKRQLRISLGGQTSFDIGVASQDKANAVRTLLGDGVERVVFIGDALFEGGNDEPIQKLADNCPSDVACPIETIQVDSWTETRTKLFELGFVCEQSAAPNPAAISLRDTAHLNGDDIDPFANKWDEIRLSDVLVKAYSLEEWSRSFSLMTAGYRDQLDPEDANNPKVAFNLVTVAILGEAKARVFARKLKDGDIAHVHVGGETRPHTQQFIAMLSRVYAAHNMMVHLRAYVRTTPIWYSSFGVFYSEYQSGDNLTASHSQFFKGGWKPLDSEGKQLLDEEADIIEEVRNIIRSRATIRLAPWVTIDNILRDFDVDEAYVSYQKSVLGEPLIDEIKLAARAGFRCSACPVGGSMKATTERLFEQLGIPTGQNGVIQYFLGDEDPYYHGIGQVNGHNHGTDPGKSQIYRNIGAQEILLSNNANVVFIWDPDGDRFNIVTIAPSSRAKQAAELGLEVESSSDSERCIVYFTPNQIFFMLTAYRVFALKESGLLSKYDWFITRSVSTTHGLDELAALEDIPVAAVRVGFKYMGTFAEWVESRVDVNDPFITPTGVQVRLGHKPRPLIMCEESGGAIFGGTDLLWNKHHTKGLLTMREKDGMQLALFTLSLAAHLHNSGSSFADFYCQRVSRNRIKNRYFNRRDVLLYDESLVGAERQAAKDAGMLKRDHVMIFFQGLAERFASGESLDKIGDEVNSRLAAGDKPLPHPKKICYLGDGTLIECEPFWYVIRASGTDAVLRYYIEGKDKQELDAAQKSLVNMRI